MLQGDLTPDAQIVVSNLNKKDMIRRKSWFKRCSVGREASCLSVRC